MQKADLKIIVFTVVMCVLASVMLAATVEVLRPTIDANRENYRKLNILRAFRPSALPDGTGLTTDRYIDLFDNGNLPPKEIEAYFSTFVKETEVEVKGLKLPLITWSEGGKVAKYAFPAEGKGLWSVIHAYIALQPDLATIQGVTFFDHGETPGLGGEISKAWFQENFIGKKLLHEGQPVDFKVVKGKVKDVLKPEDPQSHSAVDGISAATLTGNGVQAFVTKGFRKYNEYFKTIRGN
jgi:Na+-transporting NADH:ubiquinone oxidoreductase subunit C